MRVQLVSTGNRPREADKVIQELAGKDGLEYLSNAAERRNKNTIKRMLNAVQTHSEVRVK